MALDLHGKGFSLGNEHHGYRIYAMGFKLITGEVQRDITLFTDLGTSCLFICFVYLAVNVRLVPLC
jgi:hypothetical protein